MAFENWMLLILKVVVILIGGHLAITRLMPNMKNTLAQVVKNEELLTGSVSTLIFFIGVIAAKLILQSVSVVGNKYVSYLTVLLPGVDVILTIIPYVVYFLVAAIIVSAFKSQK